MKNHIVIALLSTALIGSAAYAQSTQPSDRAAQATASPSGSSEKMMLKGKWRASKLMGLDVYNEANEKLGDINELILDKDGKVNAVIIGVGGFLGMVEIGKVRSGRPRDLHAEPLGEPSGGLGEERVALLAHEKLDRDGD